MINNILREKYLLYRNGDGLRIDYSLLYNIYTEYNTNKDLNFTQQEFINNFNLYFSTGVFNHLIFNDKYDKIFDIKTIRKDNKIIRYI